ncbi:MAG: hypothetical protein NVV59_07075 [Chitinophagaceae bacterium]|nr:hypothetical protein [Chitinophagaceae bacterium]
MRTVGVMFPGEVKVPGTDSVENKSGTMYSVLLVPVVKEPKPGTNEVSKAFDECWIGSDGYLKADGTRQHKAIAWQGHVVNDNGQTITDIFVSDIPDDLPEWVQQNPASAGATKLPEAPPVIQHRRISFMQDGVSATPRHWLRSTPDGSLIGFFREDKNKIVQLWVISPNGGEPRQLSHLPSSASGPFNFSYDGKYASMLADERVWIVDIANGNTFPVTENKGVGYEPNGAVIWSPRNEVFFNRVIKGRKGTFRQICTVSLK